MNNYTGPSEEQGAKQEDSFQFSANNQGLEKDLSHWNWGAFLLTFIWGINHKAWWSLSALIPIFPIPLIIAIILGVQGNKLAWNSGKFQSLQQLKDSQKKWAYAGLIVFIILVISLILAVYSLSSWYRKEAGISLSQTFQTVSLQKDIEKLANGALIIKNDTGRFPKSISEIINSKNLKVTLTLQGLKEIPKDASGENIKYCLYNNEAYFIYHNVPGGEWQFHQLSSGSGRMTGSITKEELKRYSCVE